MATALRVLLWTVVLVAPGGFLLVPVLAATSLGTQSSRPRSQSRFRDLRERLSSVLLGARQAFATLKRRAAQR